MSQATYYHAGCPVCVDAEQGLVASLKGEVQNVHLGESKEQIQKAKAAGVVSVPAIVLDGQVFHINHGANLDDLL